MLTENIKVNPSDWKMLKQNKKEDSHYNLRKMDVYKLFTA